MVQSDRLRLQVVRSHADVFCGAHRRAPCRVQSMVELGATGDLRVDRDRHVGQRRVVEALPTHRRRDRPSSWRSVVGSDRLLAVVRDVARGHRLHHVVRLVESQTVEAGDTVGIGLWLGHAVDGEADARVRVITSA